MNQKQHNFDQRRGDYEAGIREGVRLAMNANNAVTGVFRLPTEAAHLEAKAIPEIEQIRKESNGFDNHLQGLSHPEPVEGLDPDKIVKKYLNELNTKEVANA